jgi:cytochrome P450
MPEFRDTPAEFAPDRFLAGAPRIERFTYLPFSAGPRGCTGEGFAMTEIILVLATVLQRYHLRNTTARLVAPRPAITLRPAERVRMLVARVR